MTEPELTFDKVLKIAQAIVTAYGDVHDLQETMLDSTGSYVMLCCSVAPQLSVHNVAIKHKWLEEARALTYYRCEGDHRPKYSSYQRKVSWVW